MEGGVKLQPPASFSFLCLVMPHSRDVTHTSVWRNSTRKRLLVSEGTVKEGDSDAVMRRVAWTYGVCHGLVVNYGAYVQAGARGLAWISDRWENVIKTHYENEAYVKWTLASGMT